MKQLTPPLGLDPVAHALWVSTARGLDQMGVLCETDLPCLERYVRSYSTWDRLDREIREKGSTCVERRIARNGVLEVERANPALRHLSLVMQQVTALEDRLGLSPAARTRLRAIVASGGKADDGEDLFEPIRDSADAKPTEAPGSATPPRSMRKRQHRGGSPGA